MFALREMNMQGQALFEEQMLPGSKAGGLGLAEGRCHFRVSRCMVGHCAWSLSPHLTLGVSCMFLRTLSKRRQLERSYGLFLAKLSLSRKLPPLLASLPSVVCVSAPCSVRKCQVEASAHLVGVIGPTYPPQSPLALPVQLRGRVGGYPK